MKNYIIAALILFGMTACEQEMQSTPKDDTNYDMSGFVRGADVSWLTEQEASSVKFYNEEGTQMECLRLLRELGMNAVRLRVWVNPADGWCNKEDVLMKAYRASKLGFRIMIDFHYSDEWADPSNQNLPAEWDFDVDFYGEDMLESHVQSHTSEVLTLLKDQNIDVEWVQIGNETRYGMLWPYGKTLGGDFSGYAALHNAAYEKVKEIYPNAKVVVHVDRGHQIGGFNNHFNSLKNAGGKWDVIGMSFYPHWDESYTGANWKDFNDAVVANMNTLANNFSTEVMIVEAGTAWDDPYGDVMFADLLTRAKGVSSCLGVMYWEPQCYNGWKSYQLGAFNNEGLPTDMLNAFKR
ncbi:MAG: glycosyl hydrolase 53 family protein [Mangrovibacterium sp.]